MKKFFCMLLILVLIIPFGVKGIDSNIGGNGNTENYTNGESGHSSYWNGGYGIRITIISYATDGSIKQFGHALDFWKTIPDSRYRYFQGFNNKYTIAKLSNEEVARLLTTRYSSSSYVKNDMYFSKDFIDNPGQNSIVENAVLGYVKKYEVHKTVGGQDRESYPAFYKLFGTSEAEIIKNSVSGHIYLAVEPLTKISVNSVLIAGTGTELAKYVDYKGRDANYVRPIFKRTTIPLSIYTPNSMANIKGVGTNESQNTRYSKLVERVYGNEKITGYAIGLFSIPDLVNLEDIVNKCNFSLNIKQANNCTKSNIGYINDMADWGCIYASAYVKSEVVQKQFLAYENKYCKIYCREDLSYTFPSNNMTVTAGKYFTLGGINSDTTLSPINTTGITTCRAVGTETVYDEEPINIARKDTSSKTTRFFNEDYANATTLAAKQNVLKELMQCYTFQKTYTELDPSLTFNYNEGEYDNSRTSYSYTGLLKKSYNLDSRTSFNNEKNVVQAIVNNGSTSIQNKTTAFVFSDNIKINGINYGTATLNHPVYATTEQTTVKTINYSLYDNVYRYVSKPDGYSTSSKYTENYYDIGFGNLPTSYYRQARNDYRYRLSFASSWFGKNQRFYKFLTNKYNRIDISYNVTSSGLDLNKFYKDLVNNITALSSLEDDKSEDHFINSSFTTQLAKLGYSVTDFLKTPCAKSSGCSLKSNGTTTGIKCTSDIIDATCSLEDPSGCSKNYQKIKSCIRSNYSSSQGNIAFPSTDLNYTCTYSVGQGISGPFDDGISDKGINVIYRSISLEDPFPDRESGSNWLEYDTYTAITYNRGVQTNKLYTERDPLYSMVMTPATIKKIRKYNDTHEYPDFTLECNKTGGKCLSDFLRSEFSSYITGCGIKAKASGLKCAKDEAW